MTTISLQEYIEQIELMIEEDRSAEAAMHCRQILQQYPRHIATYRLYAKSLLEQKEFGAAAEMFQRVLSAEPNDFISHVGLSEALKEQSIQPQSHWHLERAFEIQPYNGAIREELLISYRQNGESVNEPLPLTPGALARLHFRSEMYAQSAMELRQVLKEDQDRVDLEVLLAELLWRDGQRVAAVNLCHRVLDVMPDCIPANAILADIWLRTGQTQEAQPFLDHLQEMTQIDAAHLDEDTAVGRAFSAVGAPEIPDELMVEYLGDAEASIQPDAATATIELEGAEEIDASYDWLTAVESESEMFQEDELDGERVKPETNWLVDPERDVAQPGLEGEDESADWLTDLDAGAEVDDFDALFADDESDGETAVAGEDAEDALDWLVETTQDDFDAIQLSPEDAVDWMTATDADLFSESGAEAGADEDSEWLAKVDEADSEFESQPGPAAVGSEAPVLPDWLSEAEEPVDFSSEAADLPEWLDGAGEGAGDTEHVEELAEIGGDTLPDWLTDNLDEKAAVEVDETDDDGRLPGWLTDELDETAVAEAGEIEEEELLPGWLTDELDETAAAEHKPDELSDEADLPEWLMGEEEPPPAVSTESGAEDIPDWVTGELDETLIGKVESVDEPETAVPEDLAPPDQEAVFPGWRDEKTETTEDTASEAAPEWVTEGLEEIAAAFSEPDEILPEEINPEAGLPGWLSEEDEDGEDETAVAAASAAMAAQLPDWLESDSEDSPLADEEPQADPAAPMSTLPNWLTESDEETEGALEEDVIAEEDEMMPTLPEGQDDEQKPESAAQDEELSSWLSESQEEDEEELLADLLAPAAEESDFSIEVEEDLSESLVGILDELAPESSEETPTSGELTESLVELLDEMAPMDSGELAPADKQDDQPAVAADLPDWLMDMAPKEAAAEDAALEPEPATDEEADDLTVLTNLLAKSEGSGTEMEIGDLNEDLAWLTPIDDDEGVEAEASKIVTGWLSSDPGLVSETKGWTDELLESAESLDHEEEEELGGTIDWLEGLVAVSQTEDSSGEAEEPAPEETVISEPGDDLTWLAGISAEDDEAAVPAGPEMAGLEEEEPIADDSLELSDTLVDVPEIEELPDEEKSLDWLSDLAVGTEIPETGDLAEAVAALSEDGLDEVEKDAEELPPLAGDDESGLSWLSDLAVGEEEALVDSPSLADADAEPAVVDTAVSITEPSPTPTAEPDLAAPPDDVEDAMAWLEGLAAEQGAPVEELPSIAQKIEADTEAELSEPPPTPVDDLIEIGGDEDDAMAWLAGLEAEQEKGTSDSLEADLELLDELISESAVEPESAPVRVEDEEEEPEIYQPPEWVSVSQLVPPGDVEDVPEELDDAMAWMEELVAGEGLGLDEETAVTETEPIEEEPEIEPESEPAAKIAKTVLEAPEAAEPTVAEDEEEPEMYQPPEWVSVSQLVPPGDVEDVPEELDDAMAWMQELAAEQGADLDELTGDVETAVSEEIIPAAAPDISIEEKPEPVLDESLLAALDWMDEELGSTEEDISLSQIAVSEDELTDALDRLAKLDVSTSDGIADKASAPSDEVVTEFDSDILETMPDDPDDAMNWLANFAGPDTGVDLPVAEPETAEPEQVVAEPPEPEPTPPPDVDATILADMPDDPDAAMDWLAQLADTETGDALTQIEEPGAETAVPDLEDVLGTIEPETEIETGSEYLDAMPEDPDEAMAWLEKLAARQGAPAEELPSVSADEAADLQEFELPDIDSLTAESEQREEPEVVPTEPLESPPPAPTTADLLDRDKELVDALPDWLTEGPGFSAETGHTGWLQSLDEPDVAGWLAGEEDVAATGIDKKQDWADFTSDTKIETGPLSLIEPGTGDLIPETDGLTIFDDEIVLPDTGPLTSSVDEDVLLTARQAINSGDYERGVENFRSLVEAGEGLGVLIAELETAVTAHSQQSNLRHVLGDAYMRNGQLQKALETYRYALDLL